MVVSRRCLGAVLLASSTATIGCSGLLGLDEFTGGADGSTVGSGGSPAGIGGSGGSGGSTPTGTVSTGGEGGGLSSWTEPRVVESISAEGVDDDDPSFTEDGLELYFNSERNPGTFGDIYVSTREQGTDSWGPPAYVAELNTVAHETNVVVSPKGVDIWFSRDTAGTTYEIWTSTRADRADPWGTPERVVELNSSNSTFPCAVNEDALTMVYSTGASAQSLWFATRPGVGAAWATQGQISELNDAGINKEAWLSPDGLRIYFGSDRGMAPTFDIYQSRRESINVPFAVPVPLGAMFNTGDSEGDPWLSPELDYIMFSRGANQDRDIWEASRNPGAEP